VSRSNWKTPQKWFEYLDLEFGFNLDPCATVGSATCAHFYTEKENGLAQDWSERRVFVNPPYSNLRRWMSKAYHSAKEDGALVVCLVPASVETVWFQEYALRGEVRFPLGRLKFGDGKVNAPFAVAIVIFRPYLKNAEIRN